MQTNVHAHPNPSTALPPYQHPIYLPIYQADGPTASHLPNHTKQLSKQPIKICPCANPTFHPPPCIHSANSPFTSPSFHPLILQFCLSLSLEDALHCSFLSFPLPLLSHSRCEKALVRIQNRKCTELISMHV